MLSLEEVLNRVDQEIKTLDMDYQPRNLYTPLEYILSLGGKRIRPALTLIAANIYNDSIEEAIQPALALEVFHNFTLLHDDLMDKADMRRKKPTVHKVWNDNTAILSGDAMLILAYKIIGKTKESLLKPYLDLFTSMALDICGGQQYDMEFETRDNVTEEEYLEMIRLKTAVLLACGLKMGALSAGASIDDANHLYEYGIHIGLAFQLMDDLLDTYGKPETFGKNIGGDILCNKKTYLLIQALRTGKETQRTLLTEWMNKKDYSPEEKINTFKKVYDDLNIRAICENKVKQLYEIAQEHLACLNAPAERLQILNEVSNLLMFRNS